MRCIGWHIKEIRVEALNRKIHEVLIDSTHLNFRTGVLKKKMQVQKKSRYFAYIDRVMRATWRRNPIMIRRIDGEPI